MATPRIAHRHKALFIAIGAIALLVLGAAAGGALLLSGALSTAATKQHYAITYKILDLGLRYSVQANSRDIEVPDLSSPSSIRQGYVCYQRYCEECHGGLGTARADHAKGMLPGPSELVQSAREWPAEHLYYITKKGIRMTGMPAWEFRIADGALWSTVAYLKAMPFLTHDEHGALAQRVGAEDCPRANEPALFSAERAQTMFRQYACDNCHRIDAVVGPESFVGPSLQGWRKRKYIAGILPNTHENLVRWLMDPKSVSSKTMMPDLQVAEAHAKDMAAYLLGQPPQ